MYGFDSNTLTYLLTKLKSKLATRADLDKKQDKGDGKQLSSNDFTDALKEKTNNIFKEVSLSYDDSTYTYSLDFKRHNETVEKVAIKSKKKMPMGIITEAEDTVILDAMRNVTFKIKVAGDSLSVKDYYYRLTVYSYGAADSLLSTVTNNYDVNSLDNNEINYQLKLNNLYKKIIFKLERIDKEGYSTVSSQIIINTVVTQVLSIYTFKNTADVLPTITHPDANFSYSIQNKDNGDGTITRTLTTNNTKKPDNIVFENNKDIISVDFICSSLFAYNNTFTNCVNLESGLKKYEADVTYMNGTYENCKNLKNAGEIPDSVYGMTNTYRNCTNLTDTVQNYYYKSNDCLTVMDNTYRDCTNLTQGYIVGSSMKMHNTFANCTNLKNVYINTIYEGITPGDVSSMFAGKNNSVQLNVYIPEYHAIDAFLMTDNNSIVGKDITWTQGVTDLGYTEYYNNAYNIHIRPVHDTKMHKDFEEGKVLMYGQIQQNIRAVTGLNYPMQYVSYDNAYSCDSTCNAYYKTNTNDHPERMISKGTQGLKVAYLSNQFTNLYKSFNGQSYLIHLYSNVDTINMVNAFSYCDRALTLPKCGNNTVNLCSTYYNCSSLIGPPTCGPNVTNMAYAYESCISLTGSPVCGDKVTNMVNTYTNCFNLTGSPVCGNSVTDMDHTYYYCNNLTGSPACGPNVTNMLFTYWGCSNLTGSPACGPNVTNMYMTYYDCHNLTGIPVCGPNVINMAYAYHFCNNLNTKTVLIERNVDNLGSAFYGSSILSGGNIYIKSNNVKNIARMIGNDIKAGSIVNIFAQADSATSRLLLCSIGDYSVTGKYVYGTRTNIYNGVIDYKYLYEDGKICIYACNDINTIYKIRELPIVSYISTKDIFPIVNQSNYAKENIYGITYLFKNDISEKVSHVSFANEKSLTDASFKAAEINNLYRSFYCCDNLTSNSYYSFNVSNMKEAYYECGKISGSPSYGPNVIDMSSAFVNCSSLNGYATVGESTTNLYNTYYGCTNLMSNAYIFSKNVSNVKGCFGGRNVSKRLNVFIPDNSVTQDTFLTSDINSITNSNINWTNDSSNKCYYNTAQNIYIYPVSNVRKQRVATDCLITYSVKDLDSHTFGAITEQDGTNVNYFKDEVFIKESGSNSVTLMRCNSPLDPYNTYVNLRQLVKNNDIIEVDEITSSLYNMSNSFNYCNRLVYYNAGIPDSVTDMHGAFYSCNSLSSPPVCGNNVIDMSNSYTYCNRITGPSVCGPNVTNMAYTYYNCSNLTGSPVCGPNVTNMHSAYDDCYSLTGSPVCGDKVTDMTHAYDYCNNLTGDAVCGNSVIDMNYAYEGCASLKGAACGPNVVNMVGTYMYCNKLTGTPVCGDNVVDMSNTYFYCQNLIGSPVCGNKVTNMHNTYYCCRNLTGPPVCGDKVINMAYTYYNCTSLTGSPVCGPNVTNMACAYWNCSNITGSAICGSYVTNMAYAYHNCRNLTTAYIGPSVTNSYFAYSNCANIREITFNNTKNLSTNTFMNLEHSIEVDFPGAITSIGSTAFYNCRNIKSYSFAEHYLSLPTLGSNAFGPVDYGFNIYVQASVFDSWSSDSVWESYRNVIVPLVDEKKIIDSDINEFLIGFGLPEEITLTCINFSDEELENISISTGIESEGKVNTTYRIEKKNDYVTHLTIILEDCGVEAEILHNMDIRIGDYTFTKTMAIEIVEELPFSYEVVELDAATYTFKLNSNGYYESNNKGKNSSYAMCKLIINNRGGKNVHLECINYAESNFDFGLISKRDEELSYNNSVDSSSVLLFNFKGYSSSSVRVINLDPTSGTYYIKFRKDGSQHNNNDSLQFKVVVS